MSEKKSSYTIMVVPDGKGRTFYIRLNKQIVFSLVFFIIVIFCGSILLLVFSGRIGLKLQQIDNLRVQNEQLSSDNRKLNDVVEKIESIDKMSRYLSRLMTAVGEEGFNDPLEVSSALIDKGNRIDTAVGQVGGPEKASVAADYKATSLLAASREELSMAMPNISPVGGWITKTFVRDSTDPVLNHLGVDFAAKTGTLIHATAPGVVESVVRDTYFGLLITITHKFGFVTRYGHCSQSLVSKGDKVRRGQTVALVGNTGRSTAPHLHYEVIRNGLHVDPLDYTLDRVD